MRMFYHKPDHPAYIFHINKIPALHSVPTALSVRFKKPHLPFLSDPAKCMENHACHFAFEIFVRPIHIKKLKSHMLPRTYALTLCPQIEKLFGITIPVQRAQTFNPLLVVKSNAPVSVGGGTAGIEKTDLMFCAEIPQHF